MTISLTKLTSTIVVFIAVAIGVWEFKPSWVATPLLRISYLMLSLESKSIDVDGQNIHYLEGGQGQTVVLLHGIFSRKENWMKMAASLTDDFHVIALDLPGFGDNALLSIDQYSIANQTANLLQVLNYLNVKKAHFAANSMGAQLAVSVALTHPELVASIAFIGSPLGVPTPRESDMEGAIARGEYPLIVKTKGDFYKRNKWLSPNSIPVPSPILETWAKNEVSNAETNSKVWDAVHDKAHLQNLLEVASNIEPRSLVIWCIQDRIFHVSGAALLGSALSSSEVMTPNNCGHLPMIDMPETVGLIYLNFLKKSAEHFERLAS